MSTPQLPNVSSGVDTRDFVVPFTPVSPQMDDVSVGNALTRVATAVSAIGEERQKIEDKSEALNLYTEAREKATLYINQLQTSGEADHRNYATLVRQKLGEIKSDISGRGMRREVMQLFSDRFSTTEVEIHGQALQYQNRLFKDFHESSLRRYMDARRHDVTSVQPYIAPGADGQPTIVDHAKTQQDEVIGEIRGYAPILGAEKVRELEQTFRESATAIRARSAMKLDPQLFLDGGYKLFESDAKPETMGSIMAEADRLIKRRDEASERENRRMREQLDKEFKAAGEAWISKQWKRVESLGSLPVTGEELLDFEQNLEKFYDVIPHSEQRELRKAMQQGMVSRPSNPGLVEDMKMRIIAGENITLPKIRGNDGLSLADKTTLAQFWEQRQNEKDISGTPGYKLGLRLFSIHFTGNPSMGMGEMVGAAMDPIQRASYIRVMLEFDRRARTEYAATPDKLAELAEKILTRERGNRPGAAGAAGGGLGGATIGPNQSQRPPRKQ